MLLISKNLSTKLDIDCIKNQIFSQPMLDVYECFNKQRFPTKVTCPEYFQDMCNLVYNSFERKLPIYTNFQIDKQVITCKNNDVLLGFSAGLDSIYQAIYLKESGYNVHLFFAKNINTYENGQGWKYAQIIANKLQLDLINVNVKKDMNKDLYDNPFKQYWPENPIKNQLIMSVMADVCIEKQWNYLSLGDDFDLTLQYAVPGVNTTDAREVTEAFLSGLQKYVQLEFIKIPKGHDKRVRLNKLFEYNLQDDYYSCVQAGRFNKMFKKNTENKFNIKLLGNNCGSCRKCCMHDLIMHYSNMQKFPDDFIEHCWKKMYTTGRNADYAFFKPELPLEVRIKNLYEY